MTRTNAYSLLCVVIRGLAIYLFAKFLLQTPEAYFSLRRGLSGDQYAAPVLAPFLLLPVVAAVLWLFADRIARLALSRPEAPVFDSTIEPRTWLGLGVSVIGAWFLFNGLLDLAFILTKWLLSSLIAEDLSHADAMQEQLLPDFITIVFQLALAIVFLLQGPGLARWVHRMRYGDPPPAAEDHETGRN